MIPQKTKQTPTRQILSDVYEDVNWAYLARNYFGKSRSWLYHKFCGRNNGVADDFNDIDRDTLKNALLDISRKLQLAAERI